MIQCLHLAVEIPNGYRATGEWRYPKLGEWFLTASGTAQTTSDADQCGRKMNRIILEKVWSFPTWFRKGWWLYLNCHSQQWLVTDHKPVHCAVGWQHCEGAILDARELCQFHDELFVPPAETCIQC
jgi:hypothetical protein